jgi:hypothetical protein
MLAVRAVYAIVATALIVWLLLEGWFLGAIAVLVLAVWLRRRVETGQLTRPV